ncbi:MAG: WbqC family protein [Candidatus Melainabacteria bacterium]|nr:WbqC family protein [Candidatus Melainabacteria bacterium]
MCINHKKTVAIHQPNFFPWLGFFDKIARADIFIYLDHSLTNPRNPLWTKRVKIALNNQEHWLTVPLERPEDNTPFLPLKDLRIAEPEKTARKHLATIQQAYGKHPQFRQIFPLIEAFYLSVDPLIANRNIEFIESVCKLLNIQTPRIRSSEKDWERTSTELLIDLTQWVGADAYLCGGGAEGYQQDAAFENAGIQLIYQHFEPTSYPQKGAESFLPGLSILDWLMNTEITPGHCQWFSRADDTSKSSVPIGSQSLGDRR